MTASRFTGSSFVRVERHHRARRRERKSSSTRRALNLTEIPVDRSQRHKVFRSPHQTVCPGPVLIVRPGLTLTRPALSGASTTLTPHTQGLAAGTYTQNITFSAPGCPDKVVVVTLILGPHITVAPTSIQFNGVAGGAFPAPQSIQVTASNGSAWHSADSSPWFDAAPTTGASGTSTTLTPHTEGLG